MSVWVAHQGSSVTVRTIPVSEKVYSGPRKPDKFGGPQVLYWTHHAETKTSYRGIQSPSGARDVERRENGRPNCGRAPNSSRSTASLETISRRQLHPPLHRIRDAQATSPCPRPGAHGAVCPNRQADNSGMGASKTMASATVGQSCGSRGIRRRATDSTCS